MVIFVDMQFYCWPSSALYRNVSGYNSSGMDIICQSQDKVLEISTSTKTNKQIVMDAKKKKCEQTCYLIKKKCIKQV